MSCKIGLLESGRPFIDWQHLIERPLRQAVKNDTNTTEGKTSNLLHDENVKKAYLGI